MKNAEQEMFLGLFYMVQMPLVSRVEGAPSPDYNMSPTPHRSLSQSLVSCLFSVTVEYTMMLKKETKNAIGYSICMIE
jgi:hypothetical protein